MSGLNAQIPLFPEVEPPTEIELVELESGVVVPMPTGPVLASDGLPARLIKPHTHAKFDRHRKYCRIFNAGMVKQWPDNRGYLELFASSGLAVDGRDEVEACGDR